MIVKFRSALSAAPTRVAMSSVSPQRKSGNDRRYAHFGAGISNMSDAYVNEWVSTLDNLKKIDFETVLPGHGKRFLTDETDRQLAGIPPGHLRRGWQAETARCLCGRCRQTRGLDEAQGPFSNHQWPRTAADRRQSDLSSCSIRNSMMLR